MDVNPTDIRKDTPLREREAAAFLGVQPRTLQDWRARKVGPPYMNYSKRSVRYRVSDLIAFQESRTVATNNAA